MSMQHWEAPGPQTTVTGLCGQQQTNGHTSAHSVLILLNKHCTELLDGADTYKSHTNEKKKSRQELGNDFSCHTGDH